MARRDSTAADQSGPGDTRSRILSVAAQLFADKGIGATTVREIGDRAGVHSGSLYHWFRSKDEIAAEILSTFLGDIHQRFASVTEASASPEATVRGLIAATVGVIEDHPAPTAMYQQDRQYLREHGLLERVDEASRGVRGYWMTAIGAGVADGSFRDDIPAETFYRALRDALWSSMHWPHRSDHSGPRFAEQMAELFLTGYRSR